MNLANILHFFVIIILLSFTANEYNMFAENIKIEHYNIRVKLSHLQRYAAKNKDDLGAKAGIAQLKLELKSDKELNIQNTNITATKLLVILLLFFLVLIAFLKYFRIDFSSIEDKLIALNYERKTWLLNFLLFLIVSFWCLYFRNNEMWSVISYLLAITALVRSVFLATELRLISKAAGTTEFKFTTVFTSVILYFNLLISIAVYLASKVNNEGIITLLLDLSH